MIARLRILALAFVVSICAPSLAHAQQTNASRAHPAAGPRREVTATAVRQHAQSVDSTATTLAAPRKNMGQPIALMVVGGAAIILGAVIGGDAGTLFMIGGAVAGLIGLYQYLQ
jgi:hypothetical protein